MGRRQLRLHQIVNLLRLKRVDKTGNVSEQVGYLLRRKLVHKVHKVIRNCLYEEVKNDKIV